MKTFSFAFLPAALICLGVVTFSSDKEQLVDAVIADPAYNKVMPLHDLDPVSFRAHDLKRLDYLCDLFRSRDVSDWPAELQAARAETIEGLREYRLRGEFPVNYDHPDRQLPCFVDRDGTLCAVAYLIARSDGMELVDAINERYKYATISEMEMPEIEEWIAASGLTRAEVITIQMPAMVELSEETMREVRQNQPADTTATPQQVIDTASASPAIAGK
jgi:hypothetical protein